LRRQNRYSDLEKDVDAIAGKQQQAWRWARDAV